MEALFVGYDRHKIGAKNLFLDYRQLADFMLGVMQQQTEGLTRAFRESHITVYILA